MTGLIGFSPGYHAMMDFDVLLLLGTGFPYRQFLPEKAKTAQVDLRPENVGRRCRVDLGLLGDVGATVQALLPRLAPKNDDAHLRHSLERYAAAREGLDDLATGEPGEKPIHPQYVAKLVSELASDDAVFTFDVGQPTVWAARYLAMNGRRRMLGSLAHSFMANALPMAIGAQAVDRARQVVSPSGDGGFAMLMGDFISLVQPGLPVKVVIFDNGALGFVEMEMNASGLIDTGTTLHNPDFAAVARAMSVPHLDLRVIEGKKSLLFGPYAGFCTSFLKHGKLTDLMASPTHENIVPLLDVARDNVKLSEYLVGQAMQSATHQCDTLKQFFPRAQRKDWREDVAGQRVQTIKPHMSTGWFEHEEGVLEFGTEIVKAEDKSIVALLGASPGASTGASTGAYIALDVIEKCFGDRLTPDGWLPELKEIVPTYGIDLKADADACRRTRADTAPVLKIENV